MSAHKPKARRPTRGELRSPVLMRNLTDDAVEYLSQHSHVLALPAGTRVVQKDSTQNHLLYILQGTTEVRSPDFSTRKIQGGTTPSNFPLIPENAGSAECFCTTAAQLLRIPKVQLQRVMQSETGVGVSAEEQRLQEKQLEDEIYSDFYEALKKGRVELPGMPDVAIRIARHIDAPESDSDSIARIIQMDPSLTTRLIRVANSPVFGGRAQIETCRDAVTRLGRTTTRDLVTSFVLRGLFRSRSSAIKTRMKELWAHSTHVAAISHALAKRCKGFDPAQALLVGLVHDIGVIPLLTNAHKYPSLMANENVLDNVIHRLHGSFSALTLKNWSFAPEFVECAMDSENWYRNKHPQVDYCDILVLAQLHAYIGTSRMADLPRINDVPAYRKLGMGELSPRMSLLVLDEAQKEIDQVRGLIA